LAWRRPVTGTWPEWMARWEVPFAEAMDGATKHVVSSTLPEKFAAGLDRLGKGGEALRMVFTLALLACCVMALVAQTNNPFIYFRF